MIRHLLKNYLKVLTDEYRSIVVAVHCATCPSDVTHTTSQYCVLQPIPAVLEVPSKDNPYDPNQDSILSRVQHMLGAQ